MTMKERALVKLIEELSELGQISAKIIAYPDLSKPHPDGRMLAQRLIEEMGDVLGAMMFVGDKLGLDIEAAHERAFQKLKLFMQWDEEP